MTRHLLTRLLTCVAAVIPVASLAETAHEAGIDPTEVTVSGVSSGAQMAHQMHIAYSDLFSGAAMIAGGPYGCADGSLTTAMARCVGTADPDFSPDAQARKIEAAAEEGKLAPTDNLADDPVWLFHGAQDTAVARGVSDQLAELYAEWLPAEQVIYVTDVEAGHNFPAVDATGGCTEMQAPFVGDCDYDAAGLLLQHLYGKLNPPAGEVSTQLAETPLPGADEAGLSDTAYLFVPPACSKEDSRCPLHLVLHGCAQSAVQVETSFIQQSGYLRWAEANDIVLAFPQAVPSPVNPLGCWDWWGYTGPEYAYRDGKQMAVLARWINSIME